MNNQFSPAVSINGDLVVGFTSSKDVKNLGWLDASRVSAFLLDGENTHRKHLGMVTLFATTHKRPMSTLRGMLNKSAVLEVTPGESITYDLPVHREKTQATVIMDTSEESAYPGIGETVFPLILNREFSKNSLLTYDPLFGQQVIVSEDHEVEQVGDGFRHYVKLLTMDENESFDPSKLKPGVEYVRLRTVSGEMDQQYGNIELSADPIGSITNEFVLGDVRSLETFYTMKASQMKATGLSKVASETNEKAMNTLERLVGSNKDMYFITNTIKNAEGKLGYSQNADNIRVGPALEYFVLAELALMEATDVTYTKGGIVSGTFGTKRLNEGLWHQYRRGKIITYSRPGGLTIDHLYQAAQYVFKNSDIPTLQRTLRFRAGSMAYNNIMQLFREQVYHQLESLPNGLFGSTQKVEGKLFEGPLDALKMNAVSFKSVSIPGVGQIEVIWDEALDYQPLTDKVQAGFFGNSGVAWTSYSLLIEDAESAEYSNVRKNVKNANLVNGGTDKANTYYIKPEGSHVVFGYEQGRMADGDKTSFVQSSMKTMGRTFWAHSSSAALALDVTRQVWIELER